MHDERRTLQTRLSFAAKEGFWVSLGLFGFVFMLYGSAMPGPMFAMLVGFASVCAIASVWLDIARGSNVVLWTILLLAVGGAILGMFVWLHDLIVDPPPIQFFARPTPAPR
jgi:hypothetical protein